MLLRLAGPPSEIWANGVFVKAYACLTRIKIKDGEYTYSGLATKLREIADKLDKRVSNGDDWVVE